MYIPIHSDYTSDIQTTIPSALPRSLVGMTSLEQIDLSHNQLSALPDGLSALTNLRSVALGHNQLRALPADLLAHLPPQLQELNLKHNRLGALALRGLLRHSKSVETFCKCLDENVD